MTEPEIIYSDGEIIVVVKPYGMLSEYHASRPSLPAYLAGATGGKVFTVHRLDSTTRGVMVFARTGAAAASLSAQIQSGEFNKTYMAVVEGTPDVSGELRDLLFYDRARGKSYVVKRPRKGVKPAELSYERRSCSRIGEKAASLVRICLKTGRTHQIRVQFASRGMPLVGDRRYGSSVPAGEIALCCCELSFRHPATGEEMSFSCRSEGSVFGLFDD